MRPVVWFSLGMAAFSLVTTYRGGRRGRRMERQLRRIEHKLDRLTKRLPNENED